MGQFSDFRFKKLMMSLLFYFFGIVASLDARLEDKSTDILLDSHEGYTNGRIALS